MKDRAFVATIFGGVLSVITVGGMIVLAGIGAEQPDGLKEFAGMLIFGTMTAAGVATKTASN